MKNFQLIAQNVNVMPLLNAVSRNPQLWDENKLRTTHPDTPHKQVSDIWLRFNKLTDNPADVIDEHESMNYPAVFALPQARPLIFGLMASVEGERLGRTLITSLPAGSKIEPHVDGGEHAAYYDRYHIVLHALPGVMFRAGDEVIEMRTGEIWWFDNSKEHEVINNSVDDRVHLIVDIRTTR